MIRYLLDTNVISEMRKSRPHGAVVAWMESLLPEQIFLSAVTAGELQDGIERTRLQDVTKAAEIEAWLGSIRVSFDFLPMDSACFCEWSRLMIGRPDTISDDAMIAATARIHGLTVATRDEKDFRHFGIQVFNPFKAPRAQ